MVATLTVNGVRYAYEEEGRGTPLLLLHAGIADRRMWDEVMPALSAHHRVIRCDLRGYGETPLPDGPFVYADDVAALLESLRASPAHVVGVSMGAGVALDLALGRPEAVDRLVLVAPGLGGWDWTPAMAAADAVEEEALARGDLDGASWHNVRFWLDGPYRTPEEVDSGLRQRVFEMQRRAFEWENPAAEGAWLVPDRHLRLEEIAFPTLVVVGQLDQPDFPAIARHLAERIPHARVEVMPRVAHLPPLEAPEAFGRLVLDFLA